MYQYNFKNETVEYILILQLLNLRSQFLKNTQVHTLPT
jgi:hypothetical protein